MNTDSLQGQIIAWLEAHATSLAITAAVVVVYFILNAIIARLVKRAGQGESRQGAALKVIQTVRLVTGFFGILAIMVAWGIEFGSVALFATTTITLLGVALFASWSLLSNITAYFVLLFHSSYSRGTFVRVLEADNYVEGYVADLTLFSLELVTEDGARIVYPNNILLARVVVVNPKDRLNSIGKIANPTNPSTDQDINASPTTGR